MLATCLLIVALITQDCWSQDDEGPYLGAFIGKLNSYHHQASGEVYAVDDWTLLLVNFNYDGAGEDTFFWAGESSRPGPQGFIVPNEHGKTDILERYAGARLRLALPEGKRVSRLRWLAVFDIGTQNTFADVLLPDDFAPPAPLALAPLAPAPGAPGAVASQPVQILDAATLLIPGLHYDGSGEEVYFWTGVGPQASPRGEKVPDEYGYLEPLRAYSGEDVRLALGGARGVLARDWLALYDARARRVLASVLLPGAPNVPPAAAAAGAEGAAAGLPRCRQLHRDYQVAWDVFGGQLTVELLARLDADEYMAFGISGSESEARMRGADVAVCGLDAATQRGFAHDYNITDAAPCVQVLGAWRGACADARVGGQDSLQLLSAARAGGLTRVSYRRSLQPAEPMDREWPTERAVSVVWAVGRLRGAEPGFHRLFPRRALLLDLAMAPAAGDCVPFDSGAEPAPAAWDTAELFDPALRVFRCALGPAGARRGVAGRRGARAAPALAWYVNGQLAPDLQLRRGLAYSFLVSGGADPHSARHYHPLVLTAEPLGGLERLPDAAQRAQRVLAGARATRRGRLAPDAAGALCLGEHAPGADRRRDDDFATFRAYNRSLRWSCAPGAPAELRVAPNASWPDLVYYHSFTHPGMGGRIFVVDRHKRNLGRAGPAASRAPPALPAPLPALLSALLLALRAAR